MRFLKCLLASTLACAPMLVLAGGTAVVQGDDKSITIEFNGPLLRLQTDQQKNVVLIARDNKLYALTNMGGKPIVVESAAVMGVLGSQGLSALQNGQDTIQKFVALEPTGGKETVAGLEGAVYRLIYTDENGKRRVQDTVLGSQPAIVELSQSLGQAAIHFLQMSKHDATGATELVNELEKRHLGLLRFGEKVRLVSLNTAVPADTRFALPVAPMQIPPGLEGLLQGFGKK